MKTYNDFFLSDFKWLSAGSVEVFGKNLTKNDEGCQNIDLFYLVGNIKKGEFNCKAMTGEFSLSD
jgi:hypothetical protein